MALETKDDQGRRRVQKTVTINRPAHELYAVWHDLAQLPTFMDHVESVSTNGDGRSHWVVKAPAGRTVEWDAEISADRPDELIAWRSIPETGIENAGTICFRPAPAARGTEVQVTFYYDPPGGTAGASIATLFGEEPSQQLDEDLYRFKQIMETGRIPDTDGQPSGRTEPTDRAPRAATQTQEA
jgi:uncharacterized membrane protein